MTHSSLPDPALQLRALMERVGFFSFKALQRQSGVSKTAIAHLRSGNIARLRLETLEKMSQALQVSVADLMQLGVSTPLGKNQDGLALRQEYERLEQRLAQQRQALLQEIQEESVQILESLLLYLPSAVYQAEQDPTFPAVKLLPLLRPLNRLLDSWGITAIAQVGEKVPYDPQQHQLLQGEANPGALVLVRYVGYRQGKRLLYRAKVSLLEAEQT
jgi:DNA-binding Xre family transcriptional regulator